MKLIRILTLVASAFSLATVSVHADGTNNVPATAASVTAPATASTDSFSMAPDADPWQFSATPYFWIVQLSGKVNTLGRSANVNLDFNQIFNHLDGPPLMLALELRKQKFGFYTIPLYVKLSADVNNPGPVTFFGGNTTMTLWCVDNGAFFQVYKTDWEKPLSLDVVGGVRFWNYNNDITLNIPGVQFSHSKDANLWDPFIGLRLTQNLTDKLSLRLSGNYGGFAISESTPNDSWVAEGLLGYQCTKHVGLWVGYHAMGLNTYNKTGYSDMKVNVTFQGAVLGCKFTF